LPPQGARHTKPLLGVAQGLALWARIFTCAWHGAFAEHPVFKAENKPAVTRRKGNTNKARAYLETECLKEA